MNWDDSIKKEDKGLTPEDVKELIEYIKENHSWENMYYICDKNPKAKIVKYYSMTVDTRDNTVWQITFYNLIHCGDIDEITFRTEQDYNLKDKIYKWLQGENNQ